MSRTLGDDFEDDGPGGSLDLEKGSPTGGAMGGGASHYDSGGMDFDDPFAEEGPSGPLELDLPQGSATALRSAAPAPYTTQPPPGGRSGPPGAVPDLGPQPSARPSGAVPGAPPSVSFRPAPPASSSQRSLAPTPESGPHSQSPPSGAGRPAASSMNVPAPLPSARPSAAAVIAKYPDPPTEVWRAPKYAIQILLRQFELRSELESLRRRRSPDVPLYEAALRVYDAKTFRLGMAINVAIFVVATVIFFSPVILRFMRAD